MIKSGNNLEIERKFLFKKIPETANIIEKIDIFQFYFKTDKWERLRKSVSDTRGVNYYHTIKNYMDVGVQEEIDNLIPKDKFNDYLTQCFSSEKKKWLTKTRYVAPYGDGLYWEFDVFENMVMAEIEMPYIDYPIVIPDEFKPYFILEVTECKEFSSRKLSYGIDDNVIKQFTERFKLKTDEKF